MEDESGDLESTCKMGRVKCAILTFVAGAKLIAAL